MEKIVRISDFTDVVQNADLEDIRNEEMTISKNLRPLFGKLVKTFGFGLKLSSAYTDLFSNLTTYIHDSLSNDFLYLGLWIHASTKQLTVAAWISNAWTALFGQSGYTLSESIYQKVGRNPIVKDSGIIRFLPGNVGYATGTTEAKGLWLGYVNRNFFDELYEAGTDYTAGFFGYPSPVDRPDISDIDFAVQEIQGGIYNAYGHGGAFPINQVALTWYVATFHISGKVAYLFPPGALFKVENSTSNDGLYKVDRSWNTGAGDNESTHIKIDPNFFDASDPTEAEGTGTISVQSEDFRYYKFSYVYDGVQESLLSDELLVPFKVPDSFLKLSWSITKASHNKRITTMKVYRAENKDAPFKHIHTIDFLRKSDKVKSDTDGAYFGFNTAYVPALSDYSFNAAKVYKIGFRDPTGSEWTTPIIVGTVKNTAGAALSGTGHEVFYATSGAPWNGYDFWNGAWTLYEDDVVVRQAASGGYGGGRTVVLKDEDFGVGGLSGSVFYADKAIYGRVSTWDTVDSENSTKFTLGGSEKHKLSVGDIVYLSGFHVSTGFNGYWTVEVVDGEDSFTLALPYHAVVSSGSYCLIGKERRIDKNYKKAVHLAKRYSEVSLDDYRTNSAWKLVSVIDGLYFVTDNSTLADFDFFETGLLEAEEHPLAGEVSTKVNGRFARIIAGRLFQADIVLDPGGKNEAHSDWGAYSELDQYDVNPVGNVLTFPDEEGGALTGLTEIFGNPVFLKKQSIFMVTVKFSANTPSEWYIKEAIHNIGNLAPEGYCEAAGSLYVCFTDGIYRLTPNNLAETDQTPTIRLKISEQIGNVYNAMTLTQKQAIKSVYNQYMEEILFAFQYTVDAVDYTAVWAFNVSTGAWREIFGDVAVEIWALDENSAVMAYEEDNKLVYSIDTGDEDDADGPRAVYRSKVFTISNERYEPVRDFKITYKSARPLQLNFYTENSNTPDSTVTLPAQVVTATYSLNPDLRAMKLQWEITEAFEEFLDTEPEAEPEEEHYLLAAITGGDNPNLEIHGFEFKHD